jgi:hypothetical protein
MVIVGRNVLQELLKIFLVISCYVYINTDVAAHVHELTYFGTG